MTQRITIPVISKTDYEVTLAPGRNNDWPSYLNDANGLAKFLHEEVANSYIEQFLRSLAARSKHMRIMMELAAIEAGYQDTESMG